MILPKSLTTEAILPDDPRFDSVRSTYFRGGAPGAVLRPVNALEVAEALAFARSRRSVPLSIRSGGHGIRGKSTNHGSAFLAQDHG